MQAWTLFVERDANGLYHVGREESAGAHPEDAFSIPVTGQSPPELPAEALTYAELLRWQVRLIQNGYGVDEPIY